MNSKKSIFQLDLVECTYESKAEEEDRIKEVREIIKQMNERSKKRGRPMISKEGNVKHAA